MKWEKNINICTETKYSDGKVQFKAVQGNAGDISSSSSVANTLI